MFRIVSVVAVSCWLIAGNVDAGAIIWSETSSFQHDIWTSQLDGSDRQTLVPNAGGASGQAAFGIAIDQMNGYLFFTAYSGGGIFRTPLSGGPQTVLIPTTNAVGIALDVPGGKLYWSDNAAGQILRANLDGTGSAVFVAGLDGPTSLAIDRNAEWVYWADYAAGSIGRVHLDGTLRDDNLILFDLAIHRPWGIAIDAEHGKIYWTDYVGNAIMRANLDGSQVESLVSAVGFLNPTGIALDKNGGKIYWTNYGSDDIRRVNVDGSNQEILASGLNSPVAIQLLLDETVVPEPTSLALWSLIGLVCLGVRRLGRTATVCAR